MSAEDRIRWDKAFKLRAKQLYPPPSPLLLQFAPPVITPMEQATKRALDLAAGLGQNGLWLASQGYEVDIMDISRVALQRIRAEMAIRNLRNVNLLQVDVDDLQLEPEIYDLLCVFRYLKRNLFPLLKIAVKPQGHIIYETFNVRYLEQVPNFNSAFLLEIDELKALFADWNIMQYEEVDHNTRIVAIKPY